MLYTFTPIRTCIYHSVCLHACWGPAWLFQFPPPPWSGPLLYPEAGQTLSGVHGQSDAQSGHQTIWPDHRGQRNNKVLICVYTQVHKKAWYICTYIPKALGNFSTLSKHSSTLWKCKVVSGSHAIIVEFSQITNFPYAPAMWLYHHLLLIFLNEGLGSYTQNCQIRATRVSDNHKIHTCLNHENQPYLYVALFPGLLTPSVCCLQYYPH